MGRLGQQTPDGEIWELVKNGDESAFRVLYDRYWSTIYAAAYTYLRDRGASAEIVHDIFLSLWQNRATLEIASFYHYLTAATRYQVYKRRRQDRSPWIIYREQLQETGGPGTVNEGEYNMRFRELEATVTASLRSLPQRCQQIYYMSRKEQLSIAEIAERLGISRRTVENQLTKALQHLRHSLGDLHIAWIVIGGAMIVA